MTPAAWAELVGGFFIFIYILTDVIKKLVDRSKWGQKVKEEKEQDEVFRDDARPQPKDAHRAHRQQGNGERLRRKLHPHRHQWKKHGKEHLY